MNKNAIVLAIAACSIVAGSITTASALSIRPPMRPPVTTTFSCEAEMGLLRRVHAEQIDAVYDESDVMVVPVCEGEDIPLHNSGNAGVIRGHIADNEAMTLALRSGAYTADDVVGVRMIDDEKAILYVRHANY